MSFNRKTNIVVSKTIAKRIIPIPRCIATNNACSFRSITIAPKVICVETKIADNVPVILIFLVEFLVIQQMTVVDIIKAPVIAATNLCTHSIRYSEFGKIPLGHNGQSGHVNPSPAAETYPPINIREYNTIKDNSEIYFINIYSTTKMPCMPCNACPGTVHI